MKWASLVGSVLSPTALASTRCPELSAFTPQEQVLTNAVTKLNFIGIAESDIVVERLVSATPKVVVTKSSTTQVSLTVDGDHVDVKVGSCSDATTPTDSTPTDTSGAWSLSPSLMMAGVLASTHESSLALMAGGLAMAVGAEGAATCDNSVTIQIHAPAASPASCPDASPSCTAFAEDTSGFNDAMNTKLDIFDPPTSTEMEAIFDAFKAHDFSDVDASVVFHPILRGDVKGRTPKPDRTAIETLFGSESLANTKKTSPSAIWGGIQTTYINRIDPCQQVKATAVSYLYASGAKPDRYACVSVAFGGLATPKFIEYRVGPLSKAGTPMTITKGDEQLWGSRPREGNEMLALKTMVDIILNEPDLKTIQTESFDGKWHGNGLNNHEPAPPGLEGAERHTQILINFGIDGTWRGKDMNLVPLSFTIDNTDGDPSQWTADKFYYNYQGPFTRDELVDKYKNDATFKKVTFPAGHYNKINGYDTDGSTPKAVVGTTWPTQRVTSATGNRRAHSSKAGPKSYMPEGARFEVKGRVVKWMDWEFHAGYTFRAGPDVKGITFKGERVAYQIALSEVALQYGANDPVAGNVFFFDCTFGNGEFREVVRGLDCPDHATMIDNHWWAPNGGARHAKKATCIFEHATESPLWRRGGPFVAGQSNYELHVRQIVTNGNYDYMLTYKFRLDGSLDVDMESTGFLQTHYYPPNWPPTHAQGVRLMDRTGGSIHDHTYTFKVDLDVASPDNTLQTMEFKVSATKSAAVNTNVDQHWDACDSMNSGDYQCDKANKKVYTEGDLPYLLYDKHRHVEMTTMSTETRLNADPSSPKMWLFGDTTKRNKYGVVRTYALKLHDIVRNLLPDDHHMMPSNSMSKQNVAVAIRKEDEQFATGNYDLNRVLVGGNDGSQMNVDKFLSDNENILQKDLVAWVACSTHHMPHSENVPMTSGIRHGFSIHPVNFFDENPSMDMPSYLRVMPHEVAAGERGCPDSCQETNPAGWQEVCTPPSIDCTHGFEGVW